MSFSFSYAYFFLSLSPHDYRYLQINPPQWRREENFTFRFPFKSLNISWSPTSGPYLKLHWGPLILYSFSPRCICIWTSSWGKIGLQLVSEILSKHFVLPIKLSMVSMLTLIHPSTRRVHLVSRWFLLFLVFALVPIIIFWAMRLDTLP